MITCTSRYLLDEARPRITAIASGSEFWLAIVVGLFLGVRGDHLDIGQMKVSDVVQVLLTYASIALGFCLAGLTLALTLPDRQFAEKLAATKPNRKSVNSYSDLLFVFSWTAVCHWLVIVAAATVILFSGTQPSVLPSDSPVLRRVLVGAVSGLTSYCFFQFLITVITLSQVGSVYIATLNKGKTNS